LFLVACGLFGSCRWLKIVQGEFLFVYDRIFFVELEHHVKIRVVEATFNSEFFTLGKGS